MIHIFNKKNDKEDTEAVLYTKLRAAEYDSNLYSLFAKIFKTLFLTSIKIHQTKST
jgi:hypothetical protein